MNFNSQKGFTFFELLVTISIIGILSALALASFSTARQNAKLAKANHGIKQISEAVNWLSLDTALWPGQQPVNVVCPDRPGGCPSGNEICDDDKNGSSCSFKLSDSASGLIATDGNYPGWEGPYLKNISKDPWGYEYFFDTDYSVDVNDEPCGCGGGGCTDVVVIGSYGPDQEGSYSCDDIIKIIAR